MSTQMKIIRPQHHARAGKVVRLMLAAGFEKEIINEVHYVHYVHYQRGALFTVCTLSTRYAFENKVYTCDP